MFKQTKINNYSMLKCKKKKKREDRKNNKKEEEMDVLNY